VAMVQTTHGPLEEMALARTVGFEDRPREFVVWVEWRLHDHDPECLICREHEDYPRPVNGSVLVRRDAHCILKESSAVAEAIASSI
jgi:hypothetical protein